MGVRTNGFHSSGHALASEGELPVVAPMLAAPARERDRFGLCFVEAPARRSGDPGVLH